MRNVYITGTARLVKDGANMTTQRVGGAATLRIRMLFRRSVLLLLCALEMLFNVPLGAATYYVSTLGLDSNSGLATNAAWRTITKANSTLTAGDRVEIRAGTYDDLIQPANSGTSESARITYTSYNGESVLIRGNAATQNGTVAKVSSKSYITISNLDLSGDKYSVFNIYQAIVAADHTVRFNLLNCNLTKANYLSDPRLTNSTLLPRAQDAQDGVAIDRSQYALVAGCTIVGWRTAVVANYSSHAVLRNNVMQNDWHTVVGVGNYGSTNSIRPVDLFLLVEGNHIGGSMISDGFQSGGGATEADASDQSWWRIWNSKMVIRSNYFYYNGEDNIDLKTAGEVLIEDNVIVGASGDNDGYKFGYKPGDTSDGITYYSGGISRGSFTISKGVIIRRNVFYDNNYGLAITPGSTGWKCYNNTFAANNRDFPQGWNGTVNTAVPHKALGSLNSGQSAFINNISIDHMNCEVQRDPGYANCILDYNLYANATPAGLRFVQCPAGRNANDAMSMQTIYTSLATWTNHLNTQVNLTGKDIHSQAGAPQFVNVPAYPNLYFNFKRTPPGTNPIYMPIIALSNRATWFPHDFHLASGSPAIDAGTFLTTTTSAGSNTNLIPVVDAGYFTDGFGAVQGDTVQIGTNVVQITAVDYTNNRLTVTPSIGWTNGASVSLPYSGSKPDMGAFEYTGAAAPGGVTNHFEAELLAATCSSGDVISTFAEAGASGGTNSLLTANGVGDFITYTVNVCRSPAPTISG